MSIFKDKTLLITGGTGSFGNAVLRRFLDSDIKEIRIFSRDEKKQDDMRHYLQNSKVKFYIGNVRDRQSVDGAMMGGGLCVQCCCAETGAKLRIFSIASCANECYRYGQCIGICHCIWREECSGSFN